MPQDFSDVEFIAGSQSVLSGIAGKPAFGIFDVRATEFLAALSAALLSSREARQHADAVTFAFWCRKAGLAALARPYAGERRLGRGMAFHVAPSNVPVNFAYTLAAGMLAGDSNVVRLPSKDFPQTEAICGAINALLPDFAEIAERLCLVRYGHNKAVTDALSAACMSRVVWG
ncbi:MAG: acyl-CoA reductase, partial [Clostridiales bacterium]|nr:acyl-CoA reductase [Clostridiales bacterium]